MPDKPNILVLWGEAASFTIDQALARMEGASGAHD